MVEVWYARGVSAAVLSKHCKKVVSCERESCLVKFAQKHLPKNVEVVESEILPFLEARGEAGEQADLIFMDLDKTCYAPVYELIRKQKLLKPNGMLLADNVLYRGLPAQIEAGTAPVVSAKTQANAEALVRFNDMVKADMERGAVRALMMPVRDGMLALTIESEQGVEAETDTPESSAEVVCVLLWLWGAISRFLHPPILWQCVASMQGTNCSPGLVEALCPCSNSAPGSGVMGQLPSWRGERAVLLFRPSFFHFGAACAAGLPDDSASKQAGGLLTVVAR